MAVTSLQAAVDVLDRADALLKLDSAPVPDLTRQDTRRLAWAMGSAAIDTYLHWRVRRSIPKSGPLPKNLRNLEVPFEALVKMGRDSIKARRNGLNNKPLVTAQNVLHERILRDTYQSSRGVETALQMCGISDCWGKLASALGESKKEVIDHLNALARRRNSIVHEGDIQRRSKPQSVSRQPLERADIDVELAWVRRFVDAMDAIV
jgi:hypothetical protein